MSVPTPAETLFAAEARTVIARERLSTTVANLQAKLDPRELALKAKQDVTIAGNAALDTAKGNPQAVAGAAAITIVFLARHRIMRLFRRRRADAPPAEAGLIPVVRT
ncbi:MAG TPA: phosphatase [Sphingomonas sp.]|jgi:hypothetical protein|nr:phosphatase [Sphingomonas sp.]